MLGELWTAFGYGYRVDWELALFSMELEVEAALQKLLQHLLDLPKVRVPVQVSLSNDVVFLRIKPGWAVNDLLLMDGVGEGQEVVHGLVLNQQPMTADLKAAFRVIWVGRLDGCDFEYWVCIRRHWGFRDGGMLFGADWALLCEGQ